MAAGSSENEASRKASTVAADGRSEEIISELVDESSSDERLEVVAWDVMGSKQKIAKIDKIFTLKRFFTSEPQSEFRLIIQHFGNLVKSLAKLVKKNELAHINYINETRYP